MEDTLRGLILPAPSALDNADATVEEKKAAIAAINVSFDSTTMTAYNSEIKRAECDTTAKITLSNGSSSSFDQKFNISPSAKNDVDIVVGANAADPQTAAVKAITQRLSDDVQARVAAGQRADQERQLAELLKIVTPRWIIGRWIDASSSRTRCALGTFVEFRGGGVLQGDAFSGSWRMDRDQVYTVGENGDTHFSNSWKITQADASSFTAQPSQGSPLSLSRCSQSETTPP